MSVLKRVQSAISALKAGQPIILIDHPERENEGDLIIPAEKINDKIMNFMIRQGSGIVCLAMTPAHLKKLALPQMVAFDQNSSFRCTPFSISIDAKHGITTGVSAKDRVNTILTAIKDDASAEDLVKPGHIFPLQAKVGGVLERDGHTEGAVDLAKLAGFKPAAVLCEIMNEDGTMAKDADLISFAKKHEFEILSIHDLITYRLMTENLIAQEATTLLPLEKYGTFTLKVIKEKYNHKEHLMLMKKSQHAKKPLLVRIHSSCMTGDLFTSKRCDCHSQLHYALQRISIEGGLLIYLNQEGRDIGLFNKIKAYALQEQGYDTVDANLQLGLPIDAREYYIAANILRIHGIKSLRLMTNNWSKVNDLLKYGIKTVKREVMPIFENQNNHEYLKSKFEKLNQAIHFEKGNDNENCNRRQQI